MRVALFAGCRPCISPLRQQALRSSLLRWTFRNTNTHSTFAARCWPFRKPPPPRYGARQLLAASALTPGALVLLGENHDDDGKTGEEHMLKASREEIDSTLPDAVARLGPTRRSIYCLFDTYLLEPVCTALRFFHLLVIFVPVVVTAPVIWLGSRIPERDNERSGTIWWYGFLVSSMERAGAAFIKVRIRTIPQPPLCSMSDDETARPMGCFTIRHLP